MERRRVLQDIGGLLAIGALRQKATAAAVQQDHDVVSDVTGKLVRYMVEWHDRVLPPAVVEAAKHRILDTLAAIVSGARLKPGEMAIRYVRAQGGVSEASIPATDIRTSAVNAALAIGMFAHAD